jgi:hypothetical protein
LLTVVSTKSYKPAHGGYPDHAHPHLQIVVPRPSASIFRLREALRRDRLMILPETRSR